MNDVFMSTLVLGIICIVVIPLISNYFRIVIFFTDPSIIQSEFVTRLCFSFVCVHVCVSLVFNFYQIHGGRICPNIESGKTEVSPTLGFPNAFEKQRIG